VNETQTVKDERSPRIADLERRDVERSDDREDEVEASPVAVGVMQPVWTAPASTYANRPVITEHVTWWQLWLPRLTARTAHVVVTRRRRVAELGTKGAPSRWELFRRRGTLYEVDLGLHHTSFEIELPSSGDTFAFRAEFSVEWRVECAVTVVSDNLADIAAALAPVVRHRLCEITRKYDIGDVIAAERAVTRALPVIDAGAPYGLKVVLGVRLSADAGATEYAASRRDIEQKIVIENLKHEHKSLKLRHEQEGIRARMDLYRRIIDSGNVDQLALQLAHNPSGVDSIVELVREERHRDRRQVTDFVTQLLSSGAIDRWDVEDQVRAALEWLKESTDRTVQTGEAHIPRERRRHNGHQNGHLKLEGEELMFAN
jgi:DNA-binding FadR family transcriptional regulator